MDHAALIRNKIVSIIKAKRMILKKNIIFKKKKKQWETIYYIVRLAHSSNLGVSSFSHDQVRVGKRELSSAFISCFLFPLMISFQ